ncbi:MAG: GtrA family protein [Vicinamibacterales bacterium]
MADGQPSPGPSRARRPLQFYAVGAVGFVLQLGALTACTRYGASIPVATTIAVEAAIVHNFCWHVLVTWRDRRTSGAGAIARTFVRFNVVNGTLSLATNVVVTWALAATGMPLPAANAAAVALASLGTYLASDRVVFTATPSSVAARLPRPRPEGCPTRGAVPL